MSKEEMLQIFLDETGINRVCVKEYHSINRIDWNGTITHLRKKALVVMFRNKYGGYLPTVFVSDKFDEVKDNG